MWIAFEYKEKEPRVSLKAIQIYYNTVAVRKSHQTIDKTETYMQFYLPQTQEKPKEAEEFEKQWRGTMH